MHRTNRHSTNPVFSSSRLAFAITKMTSIINFDNENNFFGKVNSNPVIYHPSCNHAAISKKTTINTVDVDGVKLKLSICSLVELNVHEKNKPKRPLTFKNVSNILQNIRIRRVVLLRIHWLPQPSPSPLTWWRTSWSHGKRAINIKMCIN